MHGINIAIYLFIFITNACIAEGEDMLQITHGINNKLPLTTFCCSLVPINYRECPWKEDEVSRKNIVLFVAVYTLYDIPEVHRAPRVREWNKLCFVMLVVKTVIGDAIIDCCIAYYTDSPSIIKVRNYFIYIRIYMIHTT